MSSNKAQIKSVLVLVSLASIGCGSGTSLTENVNKGMASGPDKVLSDIGVKVTCDGEGTELSGQYDFAISNLKPVCVNKSDEKFFEQGSLALECKQENSTFTCADESDTYRGCVSKDGRYKLSTTIKEEVDGSNIEALMVMSGKLNAPGGLAKILAKVKSKTTEGVCDVSASVQVEHSQE